MRRSTLALTLTCMAAVTSLPLFALAQTTSGPMQDDINWWASHCTQFFAATDAFCTQPMTQWSPADRGMFAGWLLHAFVQDHGGTAGATVSSSASSQGAPAVQGGMWQDANGMWLRYQNGQVLQSSDGNTWAPALNNSWKGPNNTWYKIDASGLLSLSTDGATWSPSYDQTWVGLNGQMYRLDADGTVTQTFGTGNTNAASSAASAPSAADNQRQAWKICAGLTDRGLSRCLEENLRALNSGNRDITPESYYFGHYQPYDTSALRHPATAQATDAPMIPSPYAPSPSMVFPGGTTVAPPASNGVSKVW